MFQLGDHQLQMRNHRLGTARARLGLPTCCAFGSKFSAQRINVVGNRSRGIHRNNEGITIARGRARRICQCHISSIAQPAISGRQVRCGCRQSIPSNM